MSTSPVSAPVGSPPSGGTSGMPGLIPSDSVQQALEFARRIGKDEIDAIDRLHKRTLLALGIPVALLGFVGYLNLTHIVAQTTTLVVQRRLADQLTQTNIDGAVQTALQQHAATQIRETVNSQVEAAVQAEVARQGGAIQKFTQLYTSEAVAKLHTQIEIVARNEAKELVRSSGTPRLLTAREAEILTATAKQIGPMSVEVAALTDPEAQQFGTQIGTALEAGGWHVEYGIDLSAGRAPIFGMIIATADPNKPDLAAVNLMKCIKAAGFQARYVVDPEKAQESRLIVLSKPH